MTKADDLFNEAHDQELYAFERETNIHLLTDQALSSDVVYAAWELGFSQGWERGIRAVIGEQKWEKVKEALDA